MRRPAVARLVRTVPLTRITFEIHTVASPLFRLGLRGVLVALPLALVPHSSVAQIGVTTDIIIGAVTGPDSQPLTGATVQVTSRETQVTQQRTTDVRGRFTIVFSDGGGRYDLVVRYVGLAPARVTVVRRGDEDRLEANVQLGLTSVPLEAVSVSAQRGPRANNPSGPGSLGQSLSPDQVLRLPIDATDLNALATLVPGVVGIAATDSSVAQFSVGGLRPSANNVTLDGMSFGSGGVPQEAIRTTRVITNTYDVARGQFSGGLLASSTRRGTNVPQGSFIYTGRDRSLAWGTLTGSPFGQGMTQNQLGAGFGGPLVPNRLFIFAAVQGRWRTQALPSLVNADPVTLGRLGVSPDSAARFRALAEATGIAGMLPGLADDRTTNTGFALLRLDWQPSDYHSLTLRLDGQWNTQQPTHLSPLAFPATGATRSERAGGVMASLTSYVGGKFINELRGYVSVDHKDASAFLAVPVAKVDVTSPLVGGGDGIATLAFGGNSSMPQHAYDRGLELTDELSRLSRGATHRPKLGVYLSRTRVDDSRSPDEYGTFWYPSLAALAADSPASFTRTMAPLALAGAVWNGALYAGDTWHPRSGVHLTYGVRVEATRFGDAPPANRAVDSLFGVRTDRLPDELHVSPRLGFDWQFGSASDARHAVAVRGGVGEFRSPPPSFLYSLALGAPGLANVAAQLVCVGAGVPTPDWAAYAANPAAIPTHCADTAAAPPPQPDAIVFDPRFTAPRTWRGSLGVQVRLFGTYTVLVDANYARGVSQYGFRDRNLVATPRLTLADEAGRPVYVPVDSIDPGTGAVSSTASRLHPEFGNVLEIGSDLQSDTRQVTFELRGGSARGAAFRLAYTLTRARDQSSFSCCAAAHGFAGPTTAGDPSVRDWATSDYERRHAVLASATLPIGAALEVAGVGRLLSGVPFTPLVGSDVNGDGERNDRAFLFDPASTADTGVASGMRALLTSAPGAVRRCLSEQLGHIAARNSCTGPWQPAFDLQLNWRPAWFGGERRLTLSVSSVNLLGGIDAWVHGSANLSGWGLAAAPDPVLLYVRSFDPAADRFHYAVNGHFGATNGANQGVTVPFQIAVQANLAIGAGKPH